LGLATGCASLEVACDMNFTENKDY